MKPRQSKVCFTPVASRWTLYRTLNGGALKQNALITTQSWSINAPSPEFTRERDRYSLGTTC